MKTTTKNALFRVVVILILICMICSLLMGITTAASEEFDEEPVEAVELIVLPQIEGSEDLLDSDDSRSVCIKSAVTNNEERIPDYDFEKGNGSGDEAGKQNTTPILSQKPVTQSDTTQQPVVSQTPSLAETSQDSEESPDKTEVSLTAEHGTSFSTNGNTVTRDLLYDKSTNKQFIVIETRNGETFYLVIDYDKPLDEDGERYETYFLNLVDEEDLLALVDDGNAEMSSEPVCTCSDHCEIGHINTSCEVCRTNMSECTGKQVVETIPEPEKDNEPEPEKEPEKKKGNGSSILLLVLLLAAGGGTLYWFKFRKSAPKTKGPVDLDDYDYGEEDDIDEEYIVESDDENTTDTDE